MYTIIVTENLPQLKVGSNPATVNSSSQVQNHSRSSNCCSKANTDSGSGAAWTLCINFSLGHPLFAFTHISITAYKRSRFVVFEKHWCRTFDTCWQFRGKLLDDRHFMIPPSDSVIFATTLLGVEPAVACSFFILCRVLGCVRMYESEWPCGHIFTSCSPNRNAHWTIQISQMSPAESTTKAYNRIMNTFACLS